MNNNDRKTISVNDIGEYIRHESCDRRFYLRFHQDREVRALPFFQRLLNRIEPVLEKLGNDREDLWEEELKQNGFRDLMAGQPRGKRNEVDWSTFANRVQSLDPDACAYARQVKVAGRVGAFSITGIIDFVLVRWMEGKPRLWLVECKASRRDRTYHRVQVALYRMLVKSMLASQPLLLKTCELPVSSIDCVVARLEAVRNHNQQILALEPLDLRAEELDLQRLLSPEGRLDSVVSLPITEIPYSLDSKCDGCMYGIHCLTESARLRRPELLGLDSATVRMLKDAGLESLDQLANPPSLLTPGMEQLERNPSFDQDLRLLRERARARRHTLPKVADPSPALDYDVLRIPYSQISQLPEHEGPNGRLLRIYLVVDYDYSENRIGSLSAHVTRSEGLLHTPFVKHAGRSSPDPNLCERLGNPRSPGTASEWTLRAEVQGRTVVEYQSTPWEGDFDHDTKQEQALIQRFFSRLLQAMQEESGQESASIHFYVWSQQEIRHLIEACTRVGEGALDHLQQLFGCRERLEQLIYSSVQDEIVRRFALGWTGRALSVMASLRWFGQSYHWTRQVNGETVALDQVFQQLIFDFKTTLEIDESGNWLEEGGQSHVFEVRARFTDSLPAPYWRAVWGKLNSENPTLDAREKNEVVRYTEAGKSGMLEAYLEARCHALRWLEEKVSEKNPEIRKPRIPLASLSEFHLNRDDVALSASDFLRIDQQVKLTNWLNEQLTPPIIRVARGISLMLDRVVVEADKSIRCRISLNTMGALTLQDLEKRCPFAPGSFVRLSPWSGDPLRGQTIDQLTSGIARTCVIRTLDWKTGVIRLDTLPAEEDEFTLASGSSKQAGVLYTNGCATLDESVTDFVARRVNLRLQAPHPVHAWLDHRRPRPPIVDSLSETDRDRIRNLVISFRLPPSQRTLQSDQAQAVIEGLSTRIQLLQGPPGTGKTTTTALMILTRVLMHMRVGDIALVSAHTHRALDELLTRVDQFQQAFGKHSLQQGFPLPRLRIVKVHSEETVRNPLPGSIENLTAGKLKTKKAITELSTGNVLILGGTTGGLLNVATGLSKLKSYNQGNGLTGSLLVIDEASMMVFPHFLALATLVEAEGRILLAGDHRQLSPIMAHDWNQEDRPPIVLFQPFVSAFDALRRIRNDDASGDQVRLPLESIMQSRLQYTFRLPPVVRDLIAPIYHRDGITLTGPQRSVEIDTTPCQQGWESIWRRSLGVFLVVHHEDRSKKSNELELRIISEILKCAPPLDPRSIAIITPHRAQRSLFQSRLPQPYGEMECVDTIDTVERLQGSERANVIVSATVSDPSAIASNVEFILNLNRSNVAFSRTQQRLIVVCSDSLLNHIASEHEHYESSLLWKSLRDLCRHELHRTSIDGYLVRLLQSCD